MAVCEKPSGHFRLSQPPGEEYSCEKVNIVGGPGCYLPTVELCRSCWLEKAPNRNNNGHPGRRTRTQLFQKCRDGVSFSIAQTPYFPSFSRVGRKFRSISLRNRLRCCGGKDESAFHFGRGEIATVREQ